MPTHAALLVEYDGAPFQGWSRQPGYTTVEGELRAAFEALGLQLLRMRCAGRTDAGVHATGQVVSVAYAGPVPAARLAPALNTKLHLGASVVTSAPAPPGFDARTDATSRAYEYRLLTRRPRAPLRTTRVLHHPRRLDRDLLDAVATSIVGQHDFTAFTPSRTQHVFFHRTVLESRWDERGDELVYSIRGNAFLRHMVRVLIGSMLAVARGDRPFDDFRALLDGAPRSRAHNTAPPHALCLVDATYDVDLFG
jgi:tRNA pseudouridine38-40 synthase